MQGMVSLVVSYVTLTFSETLNYFNKHKDVNPNNQIVGFKPSDVIITEDFQERSSNIIDNQKMIDLIIDYCEDNLDYNDEIGMIEHRLEQFKKEVLLDENCSVLIYELEVEEIISFLNNQGMKIDETPKQTINIFLKNMSLVLNNFILQILFNIDMIWEINKEGAEKIASIKITPFYDSEHSLANVSNDSIVLFI